jgi:F0F1-type ATP synthase membrane subunit b/b'
MAFLAFAESIQLFPDGTIFIHIALVLLMIWVLNRTFFRPINQVLQARDRFRGVEGGEAGSILRQADEKEVKYREAVREARARGYEIIEKQHADAVAEREQKLAAVKAEVSQRTSTDKAALEKQAEEARAAIAAEADKNAERIAASILRT